MINTSLKNNESFLAHPLKTFMGNLMGQHSHYVKVTDAIANIEQCAASTDDQDENKQTRRKSSRIRRKNNDRRISIGVNYSGHARRMTIDRRKIYTDRRERTD